MNFNPQMNNLDASLNPVAAVLVSSQAGYLGIAGYGASDKERLEKILERCQTPEALETKLYMVAGLMSQKYQTEAGTEIQKIVKALSPSF